MRQQELEKPMADGWGLGLGHVNWAATTSSFQSPA